MQKTEVLFQMLWTGFEIKPAPCFTAIIWRNDKAAHVTVRIAPPTTYSRHTPPAGTAKK